MSTILLEPCPTEDSTNCFWDGSHSGNGVGTSFWNFEGTTVYFDVPEGATPLGVWIETETDDTYVGTPNWSVDFAWPEPTETPTPDITTTTTTTTPSEPILAETGPSDLTVGIVGGVFLIAFGIWFTIKCARRG